MSEKEKGCLGVILGPIICVTLAILWVNFIISIKHPNGVPNMDGMNRWGGHVGAAMIGLIVGALSGPFVAISEKPLKTLAIAASIFLGLMILGNLG